MFIVVHYMAIIVSACELSLEIARELPPQFGSCSGTATLLSLLSS